MASSNSPSETGDKIKISLPSPKLKTIGYLFVLLLSGGGLSFGAVHLATQEYVSGAIEDHSEKTDSKIDDVIEANKAQTVEIWENKDQISKVHVVLGEVQTVQRKQFARDEAARVTEDIRNKDRRMEAYDRLVDRNMWRLKEGLPPCSTVICPD